ncbi:TonB family protein [Sphingomonas sp. BIUV-7]|uniref:TonB family protein n=1 Tax=Sphingomonas natans TaxID=3063330 RepID=A0ABT8YC46_9SPHN|nr:TonB family protein [Sphingomonas sp. BIUV-7]MDO6415900.1 TonB family protein [Sphingomonas sp. BIUV-7]
MFRFDTFDVQRLAISAVGAAVLTATCVGAAVAPASAATVPATVPGWQKAVEQQIDLRSGDLPVRMSEKRAEAVVAVRFTADGDYAGADIARSTGVAAMDRHALRLASHIAYPQLPESVRGTPQTVAMRLFFNGAEAKRRDLGATKLAHADTAGMITIAAK